MEKEPITFPDDFIWGTAVCSHQAEGHNVHSDWWEFEHQGKIKDGAVSGPAADMLNRYPEDFALMEQYGYNGFRLSVEWARIEPEQGRFSEEALLHYENVMKEMRKRNIKVCLTLYHWVLPKWVADSGGWTAPGCVRWFQRYVRRVVQRLFPYVDLWCTLNEPTAPLFAGYVAGVFPPEKRSWPLACRVYRNLLRAHVAAHTEIMQESEKLGADKQPLIGIAHAINYVEPRNPDNPVESKIHEFFDFMHNRVFVESMKTGCIPFPFGIGEKIHGLAGSYSYMGVNYYYRMTLQLPKKWPPGDLIDFLYVEGRETTGMGYESFPPGFYEVLKYMSGFDVPLYITENGCADADQDDVLRRRYLVRHLAQMHRAIKDGMDIRGYFQWSYIDNFEWLYGFEKKLGLFALEPGTLNRIPRPSATMYGRIAKNGITPGLVREFAPSVETELWGE
jgi:beta-glucosidase